MSSGVAIIGLFIAPAVYLIVNIAYDGTISQKIVLTICITWLYVVNKGINYGMRSGRSDDGAADEED